jgi:hypothetical protein
MVLEGNPWSSIWLSILKELQSTTVCEASRDLVVSIIRRMLAMLLWKSGGIFD